MNLTELEAYHSLPGISLWKKNSDSVFIDANQEYSHLFGFRSVKDVVGKSDADVPCKTAKFADVIQRNDKEVMQTQRMAKFLEILQVANDEWKILFIVKTPYYENNLCVGTSAYGIELPCFLNLQLGIDLKSNSLKQASFKIIKNNQLFTLKELECLYLFLRHKTISEIEFLLGVPRKIIEEHLSSIRSKLGCHTDLQLRKEAIERNYLNIIPESIIQSNQAFISSNHLISHCEDGFPLSQRQFDCLLRLVKGMTVKEIGKNLNISHRTVEEHLAIIKKRLNCPTRSSLISKALTFKKIRDSLY